MNITKKKQIHRFREETTGYPWEEGKGRGNTVVGNKEVQTIMYKISYIVQYREYSQYFIITIN